RSRIMKKTVLILLPLLFVSFASARTWTSATGSTIEAELVSKNSMGVNLRRADGSEIFVKFEQLSEADREFVQQGGGETGSGAPELPEDLAELVAGRGQLLIHDDFNREDSDDQDDLGGAWETNSKSRAMGDKQNDLVEGTLVMTISPRADHAISTAQVTTETYGDAVCYVKMKIEEGGQLKLAFNDKNEKAVWAGHINGVTINETSLLISDEKSARFDMKYRENKDSDEYREALEAAETTMELDVDADEWVEVVTHHDGETLTVYLDGKEVGSHTSPGFAHPTKNHFAFAVPKKAIVDDLYLWKVKSAE
ncbi:MAG: LamG-like jellyroll fold domain-containing protein, partial [Verrucomicrobiota bacterium]